MKKDKIDTLKILLTKMACKIVNALGVEAGYSDLTSSQIENDSVSRVLNGVQVKDRPMPSWKALRGSSKQ